MTGWKGGKTTSGWWYSPRDRNHEILQQRLMKEFKLTEEESFYSTVR
jgi:hypothetical protein